MARWGWLLAAAVNLVVGMVAYVAGFMSSYFLNDLPGWDDQIGFMKFGVAAASISAAAIAAMTCAHERSISRRAVFFGMTTSLGLNAAFLAIFFGSQAERLGRDSAYSPGAMTVREVYLFAGLCAAVAVLAGACAVVSTRRSQGETSRARA